ncbi:MAG TPA: DUF2231 domain-containing protein [Gemmatimonadales bacterium]|nr:DUF2231 domain-containing protein [Gemmatimonadales bacterium]
MRSRAHFRGWPIHPALVHFPLAFLIAAFCFDLLGKLATNSTLWTLAAYLAPLGIATALLAAIPGFIDYFFTVPPNSSGKRRATRHLLANLSAVTLFALGWALRGHAASGPGLVVLSAEALGTGLLLYAAFQGGVLVSRNQIGIDHRYAEAGKWSEGRPRPGRDNGFLVASVGELQVDQMKLLHVEGRRIVLARTEEGYAAFDDHCTHRGGSLADGVVISGTVQCPWHGSQFDVRTGAVCNGPAKEPIGTYQVEVKGRRVVLYLGSGSKKEAAMASG